MVAMRQKQNDGKFFQTTKRGEIQELKEELHANDKQKQKDAVKKVIANMTVGKDVSALFADVVNCIQTDNIELKKLVYLYVMNYAKAQPELAILAINTFRKDATDPNPLIRSLAVRTMGCIRLDQVTEYLLEPLRRCCQDQDPYVRKTSAICIPKVYDINPELVEDQGFVEILKDLLGDGNPMVVANAVAGLAEISQTCGKDLLDLDKGNIHKLLAALNECNEWGQVFILDAIATYEPSGPNDSESITERVTARLSHANPAVVIAAIKVILRCMEHIENSEVLRLLAKKLNPPLVTLLSSESEVQYVALRNIRVIVQKRPGILASDVKMFFCKYNDPIYVKLEKVDIMCMLVSDKNFDQVLLELKEYASGVDVEFVRKSVRSIGRVAVKLERACERAINVLLELIETKVNYVVQEACVVVKDIFRKYPSRYEQVLSALCESMEVLDEPEAKASMIWILGEYAGRIDNADELLESFLDTFHDEPLTVQVQLLTAIVKLFLQKPSSTQDMVSKVLKCATEESTNHDLRDRGYVYWRLLSTNPESTKRVVLGDKPSIRDDSQSLDKNLLDKLSSELSLMSSVYHRYPEEFVTRLTLATTTSVDDKAAQDEDFDEEDRQARRREVQEELERGPDASRNGNSAGGGGLDLLDLGGVSDDSPGTANAPAQAVQKVAVLPPTQPGQHGNQGFAVSAAFVRQRGIPTLLMTFSNSSPSTVNGFAIQVNKNPFGFAPKEQLACPDIGPGSSAEVSVAMAPGQLPSNTPPTQPLLLQVAIKTSLDIFYFHLQFDLSAVLLENAALTREEFTPVWQRVGEAGQKVHVISMDRPTDSESVKSRLALDNVHFVAQRQVDDGSVLLYTSAQTVNSCTVLSEVTVSPGSNSIKVATRTETQVLVPLYEAMLSKRFASG
ncbi:BETAC-AD [Symbiodinium necroappetens]|uniref:AP complex subunit beta n=1 Tax=Symbiodinium necroappetens TaxID=1628268 RepID=A0A812XVC0_9DINO|nr:BETAC-AD [Symbiodinium necroappetens]|mmetsp:Transcript_32269/g.77053  ORF Transcript_32269/g.77053 Transcript_32269/m.77053 type:complete len:903 (-) Transcript_32269:64-2772(-)